MPMIQALSFSLRQIQYAVAVAESGGFGRAASACAVAQPSLSAQIAKLEDALGVELFERHSRPVHPTPAGRRLLPGMRALLAQARAVDLAAQALVSPAAITLRVGVIPTVAPYLLPRLVDELSCRDDVPRIHWIELQTAKAEHALSSGDLDAAIIADPPARPDLEHRDVGWEEFLLAVPEGSALESPVDVVTLRDQNVLLLDDGHCLRDQTMALCRLPGASESPYRATSLPTLVQMVAAGLGVTVLPRSADAVEVTRGRLRALEFRDPPPGRTLRLLWRRTAGDTDLLQALGDAIHGVMDGLERGR
jgi:LysR family transcriptional regulator, hydrogen peroxide-inducible genes activator